MPGGKERELRRRIKSVQSTKKITKAMELIAASRIAKAQARASAARPYSDKLTEVIRNLAAAGAGGDSPLLTERDERYARPFEEKRTQGYTDDSYIELDLGLTQRPDSLKLFLTGWIFPTDSSLNVAISQNPALDSNTRPEMSLCSPR